MPATLSNVVYGDGLGPSWMPALHLDIKDKGNARQSNHLCHSSSSGSGWVEGSARVRDPFSTSDLSQIQQHLGSSSENPSHYRKEFLHITQSFNLMWHGIFIILASTLTPNEKGCTWCSAETHADELHNQAPVQNPVADDAIPRRDPDWIYHQGDWQSLH